MMTTTKRNTSVAQHTAMIITRPGHQVSSVGQKVDLGAVTREWKNTWVLPNKQCAIRYASVTHATALHQGHRYMQRGYFTFTSLFFPKQSTSLVVAISYHGPQMTNFSVSVLSTCSAWRRKAQLCYPWETSPPFAFAISCYIRFSFRERCYTDEGRLSNHIRGCLLGSRSSAYQSVLQLLSL